MSQNEATPSPESRSGRHGPQAAIEFRHTTTLVTAALLAGVVLGAFVPPGPLTLVAATGIAMVVMLVIALFVGACLLAGSLSLAWISVFATDAGLAVAQALMLRAGVFDGD